MGICATELRHYIIRPTLKHLGMHSLTAENLLLGTAARESGLGFHIKLAYHSTLGIYQISPRRHRTIWDSYLAQQTELSSNIRGLASQREFLTHPHHELATNLTYATAIAWLVYHRTGVNINRIAADDLFTLGKLWQKHFHRRNFGTISSFIDSYRACITANQAHVQPTTTA